MTMLTDCKQDYKTQNRDLAKRKRKSHHTIFHIFDIRSKDNNQLILRVPYQVIKTAKNYLESLIGEYNILYRGTYWLTREELIRLVEEREFVELPRARRLAEAILIDIDYKNEIHVRRIIKYFKRLGIDLWRYDTNKGYHLYLKFHNPIKIYENLKIAFKKLVHRTSSKKVKEIEDAVRYIIEHKLKVKCDIVSADFSVWYEEYPNPIKETASKLTFKGNIYSISKVRQLLNRFVKLSSSKVPKNKDKFRASSARNLSTRGPVTTGNHVYNASHENRSINLSNLFNRNTQNFSTEIQILQANYKAGFTLSRLQYSEEVAYNIFCVELGKNINRNTFRKYYAFCQQHAYDKFSCDFRKNKKVNKTDKCRTRKHYIEHFNTLYNYLVSNKTNYKKSIKNISQETGIPRSSLYEMCQILYKSLGESLAKSGAENIYREAFKIAIAKPKLCRAYLIHGNFNKLRSAASVRVPQSDKMRPYTTQRFLKSGGAAGLVKKIYGGENSSMDSDKQDKQESPLSNLNPYIQILHTYPSYHLHNHKSIAKYLYRKVSELVLPQSRVHKVYYDSYMESLISILSSLNLGVYAIMVSPKLREHIRSAIPTEYKKHIIKVIPRSNLYRHKTSLYHSNELKEVLEYIGDLVLNFYNSNPSQVSYRKSLLNIHKLRIAHRNFMRKLAFSHCNRYYIYHKAIIKLFDTLREISDYKALKRMRNRSQKAIEEFYNIYGVLGFDKYEIMDLFYNLEYL